MIGRLQLLYQQQTLQQVRFFIFTPGDDTEPLAIKDSDEVEDTAIERTANFALSAYNVLDRHEFAKFVKEQLDTQFLGKTNPEEEIKQAVRTLIKHNLDLSLGDLPVFFKSLKINSPKQVHKRELDDDSYRINKKQRI